jgi:hypothetical protein
MRLPRLRALPCLAPARIWAGCAGRGRGALPTTMVGDRRGNAALAVTDMELSFDLVYVFAVTQMSRLLGSLMSAAIPPCGRHSNNTLSAEAATAAHCPRSAADAWSRNPSAPAARRSRDTRPAGHQVGLYRLGIVLEPRARQPAPAPCERRARTRYAGRRQLVLGILPSPSPTRTGGNQLDVHARLSTLVLRERSAREPLFACKVIPTLSLPVDASKPASPRSMTRSQPDVTIHSGAQHMDPA